MFDNGVDHARSRRHSRAGRRSDADRAAATAPIEVMVLGTYHMGSPGRDLNNARIDPMTGPDKQTQLHAVATALARFHPTAVAVERVAQDQATLDDQGFAHFTNGDLAKDSDERVQIGYRLAEVAGVHRVYAIDEQTDFPFAAVQRWAAAHGRATELEQIGRGSAAAAALLTADQKTHSVAQLLRRLNSETRDGGALSQGETYYRLLSFGSGVDQPGAALNGAWYTRNAIIFAKLTSVARSGDRIVLLFGAGHAFWLRHLVSTTPGYKLVDPETYLPDR